MNQNNSIIQFVSFVTSLEPEQFVVQWKHYAKDFVNAVLQQGTETKTKYKYVSKHQYQDQNFKFEFMKGRSSEFFPDQKVKVIQAGGYTPVQIGCANPKANTGVKIMAFLGHSEVDIKFYQQLSYQYLNMYQAYYESCTYGYILEFFVPETSAADLLQQLHTRSGVEVAGYKECMMHAAR
jgi:hypothetical protein